MSKVQRLLSILMWINRYRTFTAQQLADEFQVSLRTIQRDLTELEEWGVPLYSEQGAAGGYTVLKNKVLPPLFFTEDEGMALYFSLQSLIQYNTLPFSTETKTAINKLYLNLDEQTREKIDHYKQYVAFWNPMRDVDVPYLSALLFHATEGNRIEITYESKKGITTKEIKPFGIFANDGFWYCPAHDYGKDDIRMYRVDQIQSVRMIEKDETETPTLTEWFTMQSVGEEVPFKATLTKEGIRRATNVTWLAPLIQQQADGTGIVDTVAPKKELRYMAEMLYSFGSDIVIDEPRQLIHCIVEKAHTIVTLYEN